MKISPQATTAAGECELYRFTPHNDPDEARKWFIERAERLIQFGILEASKPLVEVSYILAMLGLQSDRYSTDVDYHDAVDAVLANCKTFRATHTEEGKG